MSNRNAGRVLTACGLLFICVVAVSGQAAKNRRVRSKTSAAAATGPKRVLQEALAKTRQAKQLRVVAALTVQNKQILSVFEYAAPDRFRLVETVAGEIKKEIVEVARQNFRRTNGQWMKMRNDKSLFLLRDQLEFQIPVRLSSKKGDIVEIKSAEVDFDGEFPLDEKPHRKYSYRIAYRDFEQTDEGRAWLDAAGRLRRLESFGVGLFGPFRSVWDYYYDEEVKIEAPRDFVPEK